jgi:hypothetical protein
MELLKLVTILCKSARFGQLSVDRFTRIAKAFTQHNSSVQKPGTGAIRRS